VKFLDGFLKLVERIPRLPQLDDKIDSHVAVSSLHGKIRELQGYITLLTSAGAIQEGKIADLKEQLRELRDQPEVRMLELRLEMQNELKIKLHRPSGLH
jgi:SMC interacting uncharacterized protein involved in chromosome segregation